MAISEQMDVGGRWVREMGALVFSGGSDVGAIPMTAPVEGDDKADEAGVSEPDLHPSHDGTSPLGPNERDDDDDDR